MTDWDETLGAPAVLPKSTCGEYRYQGVENVLEFYLTAGCEVQINPEQAITTNVRLDWTLDEFYSGGGVTAFVDRIAASLGVPSWRVKTVAVYEGSVIVNFHIIEDDNSSKSDTEKGAELKALSTTFEEQATAQPEAMFGAPVLSRTTTITNLVEEPTTAVPDGAGSLSVSLLLSALLCLITFII